MGDRVSISFRNRGEESVALFHHWGGTEFPQEALAYVRELKAENPSGDQMRPLDRLEPSTVMVDFIRHLTKDEARVKTNLYLGKDSSDGDNSDKGHFVIDLLAETAEREEKCADPPLPEVREQSRPNPP